MIIREGDFISRQKTGLSEDGETVGSKLTQQLKPERDRNGTKSNPSLSPFQENRVTRDRREEDERAGSTAIPSSLILTSRCDGEC